MWLTDITSPLWASAGPVGHGHDRWPPCMLSGDQGVQTHRASRKVVSHGLSSECSLPPWMWAACLLA